MQRDEILAILRQSDRWGINQQPEDVDLFAMFLSSLPCKSIKMKYQDTCIITFERELTEEEAYQLRVQAQLDIEDENPFDPRKRKTEAFCWWD